MVLPRYRDRNTRDSRGDGDQSCGTTAAMGLSFLTYRKISKMRVQGRMYNANVKFTLLAKLFVLQYLSLAGGF